MIADGNREPIQRKVQENWSKQHGSELTTVPKCPDLGITCRNLIKKPWVFIRVPYMNPNILGL